MAYYSSSKVIISIFLAFFSILSCYAQTPIPGHVVSLTDGTGGAHLAQPNSIFISGNYAFIASSGSSALEIVDITDPTAPAHKSSLSLSDINSVYVNGNFAYVTCGGTTNSFVIVDISDLSLPTIAGSITNGTNAAQLSNPVSVFVSGNYAYVASAGSNALEVIDISTPSSPQHLSSLVNGVALLNSPNSVFVSGTNAFVASFGSNALEIVDISNPSSPTHLGSLMDGSGAFLNNPTSVFVSGNFAYVTSQTSNALEIIDISDPTTPTHAGGLVNGTNGALISSPQSLFVSGNYCYIASSGSNALEIVDVSNSTTPTHVAKVVNGTNGALLSAPQSVYVSGNYAYLVTNSNALEVISIFNPVVPTPTAASSIGQTQFQANWNAVGNASGYFVDVSTDNFSTFVYSNLSASSNSLSITGLSTNTNYQYRLRSTNANGTSGNSSTISVLTVTDTPVATAATSITQSGFTANWNAVSGATSYEIDVATDSNLTSFVTGYNNITAVSNSLVVTGLSFGVTYYYQVRSVNTSGDSPSSVAVSQITIPANPVSSAATSITETSFSANWSSTTGVTGYFLDVATDALFNTMVPGYSNISVASTSFSVTGLVGNTIYYYQVRATNAGGTSGNASTISVLTKTSAPVAIAATSITQTSFTADWNSVSGAASYLLDVSTSASFSSFVSGYHLLSVAATSAPVSGLSSGVTYFYKVRAVNASGNSVSSNVISQTTIPPTPSAAAASAVTQTSFTANWNSVTGASGYFLDVATDASFIGMVSGYNNFSVSTNFASVTGLTGGVTYYYRVRATNPGGTSPSSSTISTLTLPGAPVASAATLITQTGFTANWSAVGSANSYAIDVATDASFLSIVSGYNNLSVATNSVSITGLSSGVTYYFQVRAVNATGNSASSNSVSQITIPPNPTSLPANSIAEKSFTANWSAATGASGYFLDVATDAAFNSILTNYDELSVASTSISVTGLTGGTTYYYRVSATNVGGTSGYSSIISTVTIPSTPIANAASSIGQTSFIANWSVNTGASSYFLDVASDVNFLSILSGYNNLSVGSTSLSVTGLTSGTNYFYRVRASNSGGTSVSSSTISVITVPATPVSSAATSIAQTSFVANWSSAFGASGYLLDVAIDNTFTAFVTGYNGLSVSSTSSSVNGLAGGVTYFYRVRSTNAGGTSGYSSTISALTLPGPLTALAATAVTQTSFTTNWSTVSGATSYAIDVAADAGFTSFVTGYNNLSVATNFVSVTGLASGKTYYYQVRSVNGSGSSPSSNIISQITVPPNPIASSASSITQTSFTANWSGSIGASGYFIDVATDGGFSNILSSYSNFSVSSTSTSVTGLSGGTPYYYRVRSTNAGGTSFNSGTISVITIPNAPTAIAATSVTQTGFTANWNSVSGATSYNIDVATDPGFNSFVAGYNNLSVATNFVSVTGLASGKIYYYQVRSVNGSGSSTSSNAISQITAPPNPTASSASSVNQTSFTANWQAATGASGYLIDVATDAGFTLFVTGYNNFSVSSTSTSVTGLTGGTAYYYRVRASNAGGTSSNSSSISVNTTPAAPVANTATLVSITGFTTNWSASTGATGYFLDVSSDGAFATFLSGFNNLSVGNVTSYIVNASLAPATTYYYRVRAFGAGGTSVNSAVVSLLTPPAVPVASTATSITQTSFTANWASVTGATSYSIDVAMDAGFNSLVTGYSNLSVGTNSSSVTGLSPGVTYYYQVRSVNSGGSSASSNLISQVTIPPNPVASAATSTTQTSFIANWGASTGATSYFLDVATDQFFNSILNSYNNLPVNATSASVTGLSGGTTYYYRVRATNAGGTSPISGVFITALTIPAAPVALAPRAVNLHSFVASWASVIGATSYLIDVASDNSFTTLIYSNVNVGNAFSFSASSLNTSSTYYYRVRAINTSGTSINSNVISVTTQSLVTVQASALTFSAISSNSITATFTIGNGSSRIVVVSSGSTLSSLPINGITYNANSGFTSGNALGNGFVVYNGSSNSVTVTGLSVATVYYFQVFEYNGSGGTENYLTTTGSNNPLNVSTVNDAPTSQPTSITFSQQTGTSVTVSFTAANPSPTGYLILRASGASPNTVPSSGTTYTVGSTLGNATVAYMGNATSFNETSLPTNTEYFYTIYSFNGNNSFTNYLIPQPAQANVTLDIVPPVITFPNANPVTVNEGNTQTLSLHATDNFVVTSVQLFHRGISESTFAASNVTAAVGGTYSVQTQLSWYDALGMEYYFIATDENGNSTNVPATTSLITKVNPSLTFQIPASQGNGVTDYQIFSFPYTLQSNSVDAVFPSVASNDISRFRMLWYNPTKKAYDEYAKDEFSSVDLSKGYWLLTSSSASASTTNASVPTFDHSHLDSIKLLPGWNQIGNPYPVPIRWSDVQNFIGQPAGTDTLSLYVYNRGWSKLKSSATLPAFSGGFVKNSTPSAIIIYIPFLGQTLKGGRATDDDPGSDISQTSWQVDLNILQGANRNQIGGIGMDPKAHYGFDRFDDSNPPGFIGMPELLFNQKEITINDLARSVVPTQKNYSWRFLATGEVGKSAELTWNADLGQGSEQLFLLDELSMQVIDMRAQQKYTFELNDRHSFKIIFGTVLTVATDDIQLSPPFPNPAIEKKSNFILGLPDSNNSYQINLQVFGTSGEIIDSNKKELTSGIHQLLWQSVDNLASGMYFYRVSVSDGKRNFSSTGKIIIP